ncbi:hypothetical protein [Marinicella meishanensis]|uniref:hypothetical protein n=1 Tax=Marinicella meishanensis TaxID=2873263 RepID=UPI001CBC5C38|nr:hypothetical protein [Marinicella sp. NBU2979]
MKKIILLLSLYLSPWAQADEVHCVATTNELILALFLAGNSVENDVIRIKAGSYHTPAGGFVYQSTNDGDLTLSGGWVGTTNVPCLLNNGFPTSTQLQGQNTDRILEIVSNSNPLITINNLTFSQGQAPNGEAGGAILIPELPVFTGGLVINQSRFMHNRGTQGSAVRIDQASYVEVANSVFIDNTTDSGGGAVRVALDEQDLLYFYNNNVMHNVLGDEIRDAVTGLVVISFDAAHALVANNVFYANDLFGFGHTGMGQIHVYHNLLSQAEDNDVFNLNNLTFANPQFTDDTNNLTPLLSSPLINRGLMPTDHALPLIQNWPLGSQDHNRGPRVQDRRIEIGAFEALPEVPIFATDFGA